MPPAIPGLHHVTAIAGAAQENLDFYTGPLGQRLVKQTVNFDAPDTYHLYYGDRTGNPGTILTFFPFQDAGQGRPGTGMAGAVAYRVPPGGLDAWMSRLAAAAIDFDGPGERFGERMLALRDPDGLAIELIEAASPAADTPGRDEPTADAAIADGFHSVTLWQDDPEPTARLLQDLFGYQALGETGGARLRFRSPRGERASIIDLVRRDRRGSGRSGAGTVHHIAFRAQDDAVHLEWRERIAQAGFQVTPVIDRQYFNAIYFREPGGVLFEIATDPPGFATDEPVEALGRSLQLPPRYAARRTDIERRLPLLRLPTSAVPS